MSKGNNDKAKEAEAIFLEGFNCAQAMAAAFGPELGIERETALKLGAPFGGGIADTGGICGAVTGALLAIGLRYGSAKPPGRIRKAMVNRASKRFLEEFEGAFGSLSCRDIRPPKTGRLGDKKVREKRCAQVVKTACEILKGII